MLCEIWISTNDLQDLLVFVGAEPVRGNQVVCNLWLLHVVPYGSWRLLTVGAARGKIEPERKKPGARPGEVQQGGEGDERVSINAFD